nr:SH3 domain-containing protein [Staphylococcus simulans]
MPAGASINYDEVMLQDGHVWVGYDSFESERLYLPVRTWNGVAPPNHGVGDIWGSIH